MRLGLAIVVATVVAAVIALIVGEYELVGFVPVVAAAFVGFGLGEVVAAGGRDHGPVAQAAAAVLTAGCLAWAAWISSGEGLIPIPLIAKLAPVVGAIVAVLTVRSSARPAAGSPDDS